MKNLVLLLLISLVCRPLFAASIADIEWITEEYPPYNFEENNETQGIAVDVLLEIWKRVGLNSTKKDIKLMPWPRGVKLIQSKPNTCLFSTTLTAERVNTFGWKFVYPIPPITDQSNNHLIAAKSNKIRFNSLEDIKRYKKKFGVVRGDIGADLLREGGIADSMLDETNDPISLVKKLDKKRYDVISYSFLTASAKMTEEGIDQNLYEIVYSFPAKTLGFAFHKDTDPVLLKALQKALDDIHADGTAERIRQKYVN